VVVNNGIVLIDYVNRLRLAGHERQEALVVATHRRFRPIMMTALATIFGMVPLLLAGSTSIGLSYTSFAVALVGGMTVATLLTLLVVPVFYTLFDDLRAHRDLARTLRAGAGSRRHEPARRGELAARLGGQQPRPGPGRTPLRHRPGAQGSRLVRGPRDSGAARGPRRRRCAEERGERAATPTRVVDKQPE
jgi:hypothetical protein